MPATARAKTNTGLQLDLFAFQAVRLPLCEATPALRPEDRAALADVAVQADHRAGDEGTPAPAATAPGAANGAGTGLAAWTLPLAAPETEVGPPLVPAHRAAPFAPTPARDLAEGPVANGPTDEHQTVPVEAVAVEPDPLRNPRNHRIADADKLGSGSLKQKCRHNLAAIELLKQFESEPRAPGDAEKRVLVRYVGWGGLPQVFDAWNEPWKEARERLEQLLTPDELDSARATTLNAHYTAPVVTQAMYALLQRLGFRHGPLREPALGLGHFIGLMPDDMHSRSLITGIEIDPLTARLAKQLYPDADIRLQAFEESKLADGFYDVALGNIPFGDFPVADPRFKAWKFVIHAYFFAATLDKVRPGGLILFITSKGTLDKQNGALREYVASQAGLLGALRLPNDAFKKNANTKVTTDLVVLRKRLPGELPAGAAWKEIGVLTNSEGESIAVNEYFVAHPEMMLGEMRLEGRMYGRGEPALVGNDRPLADQLAEVIARFPTDAHSPARSPRPTARYDGSEGLTNSSPGCEFSKSNT